MTGIPSIVAGLLIYSVFALLLGPGVRAWASWVRSRSAC